ncbi:MAG: hypothetical protein COT16_01175 [Elusimicrobia bacterium CG08_land_8_20_14_0_20_44_26]|nr:MAG: hypothetical protein COT16_01175 [Elusimicrobia bacterium CG08_land_8_20_14_0_20_44_26]
MIEKKQFIETYFEDCSGLAGGEADAVYIPESVEEVSEFMRNCYEKRILVTVSGGRSGLVGGAVPQGGVILSTEHLKKIEIKEETALLQAGVTLSEFENALSGSGLFYPPDPTEKNAAIGGMIATDASGGRGFYYGRTRVYIVSLRVALSDGSLVNLRRGNTKERDGFIEINGNKIPCASYDMPPVKTAAGYFSKKGMDAVDILAGSEGTLAIICEAQVRLLKKPHFSVLAAFFAEENIIETVEKLKDPKLDVVSVEYFDSNSLKLAFRDFPAMPANAGSALFIEKKGQYLDDLARVLEESEALLDVFVADDGRRKELFRNFRHSVPEKINEKMRARGLRKLGTDFAVPSGKFPEIFAFYKKTLEFSGMEYAIFGHIAESHLHINMMPENKREYEAARVIYAVLAEKIISSGGTISAEHGIGKIKREYLSMMYGQRIIHHMIETKKAADGRFLLGRGNIFLPEANIL